MGGRGGSSGLSGMGGKKMSISRFLENLKKNSREGMLDAIRKSKLDIGRTEFTRNGNALKSQEAILESGSEKSIYPVLQLLRPHTNHKTFPSGQTEYRGCPLQKWEC